MLNHIKNFFILFFLMKNIYIYLNLIQITDRTSEQIITDILSNWVSDIKNTIKSKLEHERYVCVLEKRESKEKEILKEIENDYHDKIWGCIHTLALLGHGFFNASNTPKQIDNLSWSRDLPFAVAYYEFLKEDGYDFPDFKFVRENR